MEMTDKEFYSSFRDVSKEKLERKNKRMTVLSDANEIEAFNKSTFDEIISKPSEERMMTFVFDTINSFISGGFDYLHYSAIGDMLYDKESLIGMNSNIPILINEEHLYKLKQVIDCLQGFKFVISKDSDENLKYSIWFYKTNVAVNLIPFKRENDNIYVNLKSLDGSYDSIMEYSTSEHCKIPYRHVTDVYDENEYYEDELRPVKKLKFHINK